MIDFKTYVEYVARAVETVGVIAIVVGAGMALFKFIFAYHEKGTRSYRQLRHDLGKGILLGLEILVAGDIIATVATVPTMNKVLTLAVIVLIRTFLSISLQVELEGKFPWQNKGGKM